MEHSCQECGAIVPDGAPFCRQCQAPQIRVAMAAPVFPDGAALSASYPPGAASSARLLWAHAFPAAFVGALCSAAVMIFPFGLFGIGVIAGGALSVLSYRRRVAGTTLSFAAGARLGAVSGLLGFALFSIALTSTILFSGSGGKARQFLFDALDQSAARSADPQVQQMVTQLKTPEGFTSLLIFLAVFLLLFFLILSALGGAIGTTLNRKNP